MRFLGLATRAKAKCMSGTRPTTGTSLFFGFKTREMTVFSKMWESASVGIKDPSLSTALLRLLFNREKPRAGPDLWGGEMFASCFNRVSLPLCPHPHAGPNCYVNASRTQVIPAGEPAWIDSCTKCRCHDGQDAGYWEGNRLATCSRLKNCNPEETAPLEKAIQPWSDC